MAAVGTRQVTRDKLAIITAVLPQNLRKSVSNRAEAYQAHDHIPLSPGQRAPCRTLISQSCCSGPRFILTRPLGATVGDFLDKPLEHGGLALSRPIASAVIAVLMIMLVLVLPQRAGTHPGESRGVA